MRHHVYIAAILVSMSFVATVHAAALRTVALSGQSAPGTAGGATFETFGALVHTQELWDYGGAVLNDAGQIAFRANLTGSGVDSTNNQGVWSEGSGSLALIARTGSQAPGAASGVNFSTDPALELFSPVLNDAGQTAFYGATTDGGLGLWSEGSGSLAPVARSGLHAAGTPSGVNFTFANLYDYLESPILNNAGQTSFRSYVAGAGVNGGNNFGLWSEGSGSLQLLARSGNPAPGMLGVNHGGMYEAGLNDAGKAVFFSLLTGSGVNNTNDRSIWSNTSGSLALVARSGSQAPGLPSGVNFSNFQITGAINNAGQLVFVAGLSSETSQWGQNSLWLNDSGGTTLLARRGTQAPGTPSGVNYEDFGGWTALNDAGQTLFTALLSGNGVDASNELALYLSDGVGNQTLVSRKGDQAPGTTAGTLFFATDQFDAFGPLLNNAGQAAMTSHLTGVGVDSTNDFGIWATDKIGDLQLIARKGDVLEVVAGDVRTISDLKFVGAANGDSNGWPSGFNNVGQVAFWANFTDGSQGVFVSNKVATVPGDFNFDGTVDAGDYVAWRNGLGTLYSPSHYDIWRANFGTSLGSGSGWSLPSAQPLSAAVPEPTALLLSLVAIVGALVMRSRGSALKNCC